MGLGDAEAVEVVLQQSRAHRRPGVGVDELRGPMLRERGLEHLDRQRIDFAVLDSAADELAGVDIDDRVSLERNTTPRGPQVCDVPAPDLIRAGRHEHRCHERRAARINP